MRKKEAIKGNPKQQDVLSLINERQATMSRGQRQIALYILNHYDRVGFMTASKLGAVVGVSESTVVRFAFELGYDGYPGLQRALQEIIRNRLTTVQRIEVANEQIGTGEVLDKVLNLDIDRIRRTLEETDRSTFKGAVDSILQANTIYIIGARSSASLARFLDYYFRLMFPTVKLVDAASTGEVFEQIMRIDEHDVIIGFSFPRYSKRTSSALHFAKQNGAKVIAITDSISSPLVRSADYFLQARSDMASFVDSMVAPLSLINALIVAIGLKKQDEMKKTFDRLEQIWDAYDVFDKSGGSNG